MNVQRISVQGTNNPDSDPFTNLASTDLKLKEYTLKELLKPDTEENENC